MLSAYGLPSTGASSTTVDRDMIKPALACVAAVVRGARPRLIIRAAVAGLLIGAPTADPHLPVTVHHSKTVQQYQSRSHNNIMSGLQHTAV